DAHRRSVVLAKNHGELLPLREESLQGTRVYLERFAPQVTVRQLDALRRRIARAHPEVSFTTDYRDADTALLLLQPVIGSYFEYVGIGDLSIEDRKSTRLNSSHVSISYAVFCLKKQNA